MNTQTDSFYQQQAMPLTRRISSGKVIRLYPRQTRSLLDDKGAYLMLHVAVGAALGASLLMMGIAMLTQLWIQRSTVSLALTVSFYAAITYYYHGIKSKKTPLLFRGVTIVVLSALGVLLLIWAL